MRWLALLLASFFLISPKTWLISFILLALFQQGGRKLL